MSPKCEKTRRNFEVEVLSYQSTGRQAFSCAACLHDLGAPPVSGGPNQSVELTLAVDVRRVEGCALLGARQMIWRWSVVCTAATE